MHYGSCTLVRATLISNNTVRGRQGRCAIVGVFTEIQKHLTPVSLKRLDRLNKRILVFLKILLVYMCLKNFGNAVDSYLLLHSTCSSYNVNDRTIVVDTKQRWSSIIFIIINLRYYGYKLGRYSQSVGRRTSNGMTKCNPGEKLKSQLDQRGTRTVDDEVLLLEISL